MVTYLTVFCARTQLLIGLTDVTKKISRSVSDREIGYQATDD
jgi:hypothetical protein